MTVKFVLNISSQVKSYTGWLGILHTVQIPNASNYFILAHMIKKKEFYFNFVNNASFNGTFFHFFPSQQRLFGSFSTNKVKKVNKYTF